MPLLKGKVLHVHMEHDPTIKKNKPAIRSNLDEPGGHHAKWNKPDKEKQISLTCGIWKSQTQETQSRMLVTRDWGRGRGNVCLHYIEKKTKNLRKYCMPPDSFSNTFALLESGENSGTGLLSSWFLLEAVHQVQKLGT